MEQKKQKNRLSFEKKVLKFQKNYPQLCNQNEARWLRWLLKKNIKISYWRVIKSLSNPTQYIISDSNIEDRSLLDVIHNSIRKSLKREITFKLSSGILKGFILIYWLNFENTLDVSPVNNTINLILALLLIFGEMQFISFFKDAKLKPSDVYQAVIALSALPFESYFDENGYYIS